MESELESKNWHLQRTLTIYLLHLSFESNLTRPDIPGQSFLPTEADRLFIDSSPSNLLMSHCLGTPLSCACTSSLARSIHNIPSSPHTLLGNPLIWNVSQGIKLSLIILNGNDWCLIWMVILLNWDAFRCRSSTLSVLVCMSVSTWDPLLLLSTFLLNTWCRAKYIQQYAIQDIYLVNYWGICTIKLIYTINKIYVTEHKANREKLNVIKKEIFEPQVDSWRLQFLV